LLGNITYFFIPAVIEDSTPPKDDDQKANADLGIFLEEVLEEAPKWKVLRVSVKFFVSQFSFGRYFLHKV
jgi:hypothetical protein